jgi:hypothetical protein
MTDEAFAVVVHNLFESESSDNEWTPLPKRLPRILPLTSEFPVVPIPPTPPRLLPAAPTNANGKLPSTNIPNIIRRYSYSNRGLAASQWRISAFDDDDDDDNDNDNDND